ncbi:ferredoxin [Micromonospora sonchi]|uniref:Ferredoxin n=1 Tax=Micromonospora sonchi TaxID=1763543 RepID=A0A917U3G1_9ACTN|nr:FAD-dependent oxidoreductase [Micromonospora sonchi]GGM55489.1 ferredoxin [Micromonospora sonchi]
MADPQVFAIVGAGLTGAKAAEGLREAGFAGRIVLIGEETEPPYERPPLSKGYLLGTQPREKAYVHEPGWYRQHDVELLLGVRATGLVPADHTLILDGHESMRYDKLLLATGSRVRRLDVPGAHLSGVRYLRTLSEADTLVEHMSTAPRVVVVGAGWIGLETAAAARARGCDVTVVEQDSAPLRRVLGDEVAEVFTQLHQARGVSFRFGSGVREFLGADGRLSSVVLTDGTRLPADLAIVGIGITPATDLAAAAGLALENGIATDASLRTSDPDIYAAGDVASVAHPLLGRRIRVEHWANALNGGNAASRAMLGEPLSFARIPYFFSDQYDLGMEYSGWVEPGGYDEVVFRPEPAIVAGKAPEFIAFWLSAGRVLAGMNVNVWDVTEPIQELVRQGHAGKTVAAARLADPRIPLGDLVS